MGKWGAHPTLPRLMQPLLPVVFHCLIPSALAHCSFTPKTIQVGRSHTLGCLAFNKVYDLNLVLLTPSLQASAGNKNVEVVYSFPSYHGDPHTRPKPACVYERRVGLLGGMRTHTRGGGAGGGGTFKTLAAFQSLASSQNIK